MSSKHDYVPYVDGPLLTFAKTLFEYAQAHHARWEAPSPHDLLNAPLIAFENALTAYNAPNHGKVDTLTKNEAKKALSSALRVYVQAYIAHNPKVTDEDRELMGLPLYDTVPTAHGASKVKPNVEARPAGKGLHRVTVINPLTSKKDKPDHVTGVVYACKLRNPDEPRAKAKDMPTVFQTGATRDFQWEEEDYGKMADYAAAYEVTGGKRGPWSDVVSDMVS